MFTANVVKRLSPFWWGMGLAAALLVPLHTLYAADGATAPQTASQSGGMEVRNLQTHEGEVSALISLYGKAAQETKLSAQLVQEPALPLSLKTAFPALHLGVIVDNASLCKPLGIDAAVLKLLSSLPQTLNRTSRVTVISFSGHTLEVLGQALPVADVRKLRLNCEPRAVSGSPEKALGRFIVTEEIENLPKVAWLFSSGNLRMQPAALQSLKKSGVPIDVFLYNRTLGPALSVIAEEQAKELRDGQYHYQVVSAAEVGTPTPYYSVRATIPDFVEGGPTGVKFAAMKGDEAVASSSQILELPKAPDTSWIRTALLSLLGAALAIGLVMLLMRVFRRRVCAQCGLPLAADRKQCSFPHTTGDAALIGTWLTVDEDTRDRKKVVRLDKEVVEIGTHRRSHIPLVRPKSLRRACLAKIRRISLGNGQVAYRIEPTGPRGYAALFRNGNPILQPRNLAHGDVIQIGDTQVSFVTHQEVRA